MSEYLNNRRFLASDSPHNHRTVSDTNRLRLVVGISIILFLLVSLTLVYCFIRKLIRNSPSQQPHQPCNHQSLRNVLLQSLPVTVYNRQNMNSTTTFEKDCAICLEVYKDGEELRTLTCDHVFHCFCIDKWLLESGLCPVCRRVVVNMEQIRVENARRCSERLMATFPPRGGLGGGGQAVL